MLTDAFAARECVRAPRRISQDWIIDESWWGDSDLAQDDWSEAAAEETREPDVLHAVAPNVAVAGFKCADAAPHRELRVYLGASTYLLVPVEHACSSDAAGPTSLDRSTELTEEALVVARNPPHTIVRASLERVHFLKAHARDVIVAQALLGIAQLEWEAYLVLLTNSQAVTRLPQGELRRVTDAKILPIGIDNVGVHWHTGAVLSSPHATMQPAGAAASDWASLLAKRSFMLRSFKDLLKSGWLLFSWDFDCSRNQQTLASFVQRDRQQQTSTHVPGTKAMHPSSKPRNGAGDWSTILKEEERPIEGRGEGEEREAGRSGGGQDSSSRARGKEWCEKGWSKRGREWCEKEGRKRGWDMRFVWNATWLEPLLYSAQEQTSLSRWLLPLIYGFGESVMCHIDKVDVELVLIARRSCKRAGVRFCRRGVDAEGNVANFVETEQIVQLSNIVSSFVCIRGSIPLFWKQDMNDWTQLKPKLSVASNEPVSTSMPSSSTPCTTGFGAWACDIGAAAKALPRAYCDSHVESEAKLLATAHARCDKVVSCADASDATDESVASSAARTLETGAAPAAAIQTTSVASAAASDVPLGDAAGVGRGAAVVGGMGMAFQGAKEGGGKEGGKLRLNRHDVGLARHFDELRALYGEVLVLVSS